jgi:hypothetical protein
VIREAVTAAVVTAVPLAEAVEVVSTEFIALIDAGRVAAMMCAITLNGFNGMVALALDRVALSTRIGW